MTEERKQTEQRSDDLLSDDAKAQIAEAEDYTKATENSKGERDDVSGPRSD